MYENINGYITFKPFLFSAKIGTLLVNSTCFRDMKGDTFIEERKGDLFTAPPSMAQGHFISADGNTTGSGAMQFGGHREIEKCHPTAGGVVVLEEYGRLIYNLVTKEKFYDQTTLTSLNKCVREMREHMIQNHVMELALPRMGCGFDGVMWADVYAILEDVFRYTGIKIVVFTLK